MIASLIRSNLKKFKPYSSARSLYKKGLFFDANENALGSVVTTSLDDEINRYPDPQSISLRKALSAFLAVKEENIFVGNGSDEAIDLLVRLFVESDEEILVNEPTYGMYSVAAELANVRVNRCFLKKDFTLDITKVIKSINPKTKIVFCCSPNSPTGTITAPEDIEKLCRSFRGIVVVDEAYIEFTSSSSMVGRISQLPNLVVLRTFSKAWGLAGIRVGYVVAQRKTIDYLNRIKLPYNLNKLSSEIAMQALSQYPKMVEWKERMVEERNKLSKGLKQLGFEVFRSDANFLLVRIKSASNIAARLAVEYGIIVRVFKAEPMLKDCIRISVGTPGQNKLLIISLTKLL